MSDRLGIAYAEASAAQKLRAYWAEFCDADPVPAEFIDDMDAAGLAECVPVDDEALESAFAAERGIEPGGMMWVLTAAGRAALSHGPSS